MGDFKDVPIVQILVKPGDVVKAEAALVVLESDKASVEVPSPVAGTVQEVRAKVGERVSEGTVLVTLEPAAEAPAPKPPVASEAPVSRPPAAADADASKPPVAEAANLTPPPAAPPPRPRAEAAPAPVRAGAMECEVLVLGSGPGGYSAAFRAADLGKSTVLVERYPSLGGVCLNVGCIPSKALLHVGAVMDEARALAEHGVVFGAPAVDLPGLRAWKDKVVGKLTSGLTGMAKSRHVQVVRGSGAFLDAHHVEVELMEGPAQQKTGAKAVIHFEKAIIANGSQAVQLPFMPSDPRVVDSTTALALPRVPKRMLIIGGGIIGLEMGTVYSSLGARLDVVELLDGLMLGADRDLVRVWERSNRHRFDRVMLKTKVVAAEARPDAVHVSFEGEAAPEGPQPYELVLVAVGRTPNGKMIAAERAGVQVSERGFIPADAQMRTNVAHIFAIGDVAGPPMLAHKAVHEGHVAAEAASGLKRFFDARAIPSVAYTDPQVAWVGVTEDEAKAKGQTVGKAVFPWAASGRAIANGREDGFTKLLFDADSHRVVGGGIVGAGAGDLIAEIALAIEMGADAVDLGKTIHPHPTTSESIGMAAEAFEGVCTDLPPAKRRG
jgi:dihydrolipoamide dehydrogenase